MADIATLIDNALNHEWDGHCVLLDIPRQTAEFDVVYNAMEFTLVLFPRVIMAA